MQGGDRPFYPAVYQPFLYMSAEMCPNFNGLCVICNQQVAIVHIPQPVRPLEPPAPWPPIPPEFQYDQYVNYNWMQGDPQQRAAPGPVRGRVQHPPEAPAQIIQLMHPNRPIRCPAPPAHDRPRRPRERPAQRIRLFHIQLPTSGADDSDGSDVPNIRHNRNVPNRGHAPNAGAVPAIPAEEEN